MQSDQGHTMPLSPDQATWEATRPGSALSLKDVKPFDRIETYIPGKPEENRYYEILPLEEEDSRGDALVTYRDLETGEKHTGSTATLGLSLSPGGTRYCWAIPYNPDD